MIIILIAAQENKGNNGPFWIYIRMFCFHTCFRMIIIIMRIVRGASLHAEILAVD